MKLSIEEIMKFLNTEQISFSTFQKIEGYYSIASLFNPIEGGFYFYTSKNSLSLNVTNSLILVSHNFEADVNNGNKYIYISNDDPQRIYYLLLNSYFAIKSTGIISSTAIISPNAEIGRNVQIDEYCVIDECRIGDNVIIGSHTRIHNGVVIKKNTEIEAMSIIGATGLSWTWDINRENKIRQPQLGGVKIGENCFLGANTILVRGSINEDTIVGRFTFLAPGCRIGHGTKIGESVHLSNNVVTAGNTIIGDFSFIGSNSCFRSKVELHSKTVVGIGAVVIKNTTAEGKTLIGVPAIERETKEKPNGMPLPK